MKKIIFPLLILLGILAVPVFMHGCGDRGIIDEPSVFILAADNASDYTVVRSDTSSKTVTVAAQTVCAAVKSRTGINMRIATDWDGEDNNSGRREIIVGVTNRQISIDAAAGLSVDDYVIKAYPDGKIVIVGGSDEATVNGVLCFVRDYLGYSEDKTETAAQLSVPDDLDVFYRESYLDIIKNRIAGYVIVRAEDASKRMLDALQELRAAIRAETDTDLRPYSDFTPASDIGKPQIILGETNRPESIETASGLTAYQAVIKVCENGNIVIVGGSDAATIQAMRRFIGGYVTGRTTENSDGSIVLRIPASIDVCHTYAEVMDRENGSYEFRQLSMITNKSDADQSYIVKNSGAALSTLRFTDLNTELIYKFDISGYTEPAFELTVAQNYVIEVSPDNVNFITVVNWIRDGNDPVYDTETNMKNIIVRPYEYGIFDTVYIRFTDADPSDGNGCCLYGISLNYYQSVSDAPDYNIFNLSAENISLIRKLATVTEASAVEDIYETDKDGGMIYNPISREKKTALSAYEGAKMLTGQIEKNGVIFKYSVPESIGAYDAVPIRYTVSNSRTSGESIHISTASNEDPDRLNGSFWYDMNLPDRVDLKWEYLGHVAADSVAGVAPYLTGDFSKDSKGAQYPDWDNDDISDSGTVRNCSRVWFRFRYTNIGNTILDPDGNGTFSFEPLLYKKNASGEWELHSAANNNYYRIFTEVYPGDSDTVWFGFSSYSSQTLPSGEYKIALNGIIRSESDHPEQYWFTMFGGITACTSEFYFKVAEEAAETEASAIVSTYVKATERNTWLHTFEEFMSSYESLLNAEAGEYSGTMYIQCPPWCEQIVLKLIIGNGDTLAAASVPVKVSSDNITVTLNPDNNNYVVLDDGTRFPAIMTQSMADMRESFSASPYADENVIRYLQRIKDSGVNVISNTAWYEYNKFVGVAEAGHDSQTFWFQSDILKLLGINMEGYVTYPYRTVTNITKAMDMAGVTLPIGSYGSDALARGNAIKSMYQYKRWGANYWIAGDDTLLLSSEDTRGWLYIDRDGRDPMDEASKENFRTFLRLLYGSIDELNRDWGSSYGSFYDIDPEVGTIPSLVLNNYKVNGIPFEDWSKPVMYLDIFRTLERIGDYETMLDYMSETMPTAKVNLRTEGANWCVSIDPSTTNSHYRHVYYSQRRNAMIAELMEQSDAFYAHSDYTTLPYTPTEVRYLTEESVKSGIIPMLLPQFNRMRDIAVNSVYGQDYSGNYNLSGKYQKAVYVNCCVSLFEWFKATYEAGGVPGILWSDYFSDGIANDTQIKEIKFFIEKLTETLSDGEGRQWATEFEQDTSVRNGSVDTWAYDAVYLQSLIDKVNGGK